MNNDNCIIDKLPLILLFSDFIAQPAPFRCSSRVWDFPNKYFAKQKWSLYIRRHCLLQWCWFSGRLFFCSENFRVCIPQQAGRVGTNSRFLNLIFYKSDFKNTCWASPKPNIQHKIAPTEYLSSHWTSKFSQKKFVLVKFALIHSILHQTGTITSGFEGKKRK